MRTEKAKNGQKTGKNGGLAGKKQGA